MGPGLGLGTSLAEANLGECPYSLALIHSVCVINMSTALLLDHSLCFQDLML